MEQGGRMGTALPLSWKISQVFEPDMAKEIGMDAPEADANQQTDVISTVQFDKSGGLIASGDSGGNIVLYEQCDSVKPSKPRNAVERLGLDNKTHFMYRIKTQFLSHETEVHEEKVKMISTLSMKSPEALGSSSMASASTALSGRPKLAYAWHYGRPENSFTGFSSRASKGSLSPPPRLPKSKSSTVAVCRRKYANAHYFPMNSISVNSDCETFISADEVSINLWNLEVSGQTFNILDLRPFNTDNVSEMIRTAELHPSHCNILAYGTSKGLVRLLDLRQSAICDTSGKLFTEHGHRPSRTAALEVASSIADIKFKNDGRHMVTRDYMTLKLWDINMNSHPVATYNVHGNLQTQVKELYERELLADKFDCCLSGDGCCAATGSYSYKFRLFDLSQGSTGVEILQGGRLPQRLNAQTENPWTVKALKRCGLPLSHIVDRKDDVYIDSMKLLNLTWHPSANLIGCAVADSLFLYYA